MGANTSTNPTAPINLGFINLGLIKLDVPGLGRNEEAMKNSEFASRKLRPFGMDADPTPTLHGAGKWR